MSPPDRVTVVGAGTMGVGIAVVFAASGLPTTLVDSSPAQTSAAHARALELIARFAELGAISPETAARTPDLLEPAGSIADGVRGAELIVEAVFERLDVKHDVYRAVEAAAAPGAIIASNTSSIPIASLAEGLSSPGRFLGVHWFVPPMLVPCVEVIPTATTEPAVTETVVALLRRLGKRPVVVGDGPGFVANRIQFALFREATRIVAEGVATAEQIDEVVSSSFGFRLPFFGPFTIADMAGLDVYADIFATLEGGLGPEFAAPPMLTEQVERGDIGVKAGRGFLDLSPADGAALVERRDRAYLALSRLRDELAP